MTKKASGHDARNSENSGAGKPSFPSAKKAMPDDTKNLLAALSYPLWPVALVLLIVEETKPVKQRDRWLRHHAYNALGFFVGALLLYLPIALISWIPVIGWVTSTAFWIAIIVLAVIFAMQAYRREPVNVPVMTEFLERNVKEF